MRYTTIVDISGMRCYTNKTARLLYLHLCLRAGYHTEDQDQVRCGLRPLAAELGVTFSALRCALAALRADGLVSYTEDGALLVKKFVQPVIAKTQKTRTATEGSKEAEAQDNERRRLEDELARLRRWYRDAMDRHDDTSAAQILAEAKKVRAKLNRI